jgi:hypothetical protein
MRSRVADRETPIAGLSLEIPDLRAIARHAVPRFVECTLVPLGLFVLGLRVLGIWGAMFAGLGFVYAAIATRIVMRRKVPGLLVIGAMTLTARTVIAMAAHSTVVYFLQPSLGTIMVAGAFLLSVGLDKPLAARLAADFCPLSTEVHGNRHVRHFFRRVSLLWAAAQAANATLTIWLLFSQSVGTFVVLRSVVSAGVTVTAIAISTLWFHRSMARHGITVRTASVAARVAA